MHTAIPIIFKDARHIYANSTIVISYKHIFKCTVIHWFICVLLICTLIDAKYVRMLVWMFTVQCNVYLCQVYVLICNHYFNYISAKPYQKPPRRCPFCPKSITEKLKRHMISIHSDQPAVQAIIGESRTDLVNKQVRALLKEGIYIHNKEQAVTDNPIHQKVKASKGNLPVHCRNKNCKGSYSRTYFYRHRTNKWWCFRPLLCTFCMLNWAKQTPGIMRRN